MAAVDHVPYRALLLRLTPSTIHMKSAARLLLAPALLFAGACALSSSSSSTSAAASMPAADMSMSPPSPDPRVGLRPGTMARYARDTTKRVIVQPAEPSREKLAILFGPF